MYCKDCNFDIVLNCYKNVRRLGKLVIEIYGDKILRKATKQELTSIDASA